MHIAQRRCLRALAAAAALLPGSAGAAAAGAAALGPRAASSGDSGADVAAVVAAAHRDLGAGARIETVGAFVLAGAPSLSRTGFDHAVDLTRRALVALHAGRFDASPARPVGVWLFPTAKPYQAWCHARWSADCISIYGFFLSDERLLVMNVGPGLGTLTHELVHPILRADFPRAPTWIDEGIASLYEAPVIAKPGSIRGIKNWRLPRLRKALDAAAERGAARLDRLFALSDDAFRGDGEDLHYALARYFCQWMDAKGWLWPFYRRWRDDAAADPTGEATFRAVTGLTPAAAHAAFEKWVRAL